MNETLIITYWRRGFDTYDIARFIGPLDKRGNPTCEALIYKLINDWLESRRNKRKSA